MLLIHTADLHLHRAKPERMTAFKNVCCLAQEKKADALLIAGDLFDSLEDAVALRSQVRHFFEEVKIPVFLIPGNHDATAFTAGQYYGSNVKAANSDEPVIWDYQGLPLIGLPYSSGRSGCDFLKSLSLIKKDQPLVVIAHGNFYSSATSSFFRLYQAETPEEAHFWDRDFLDFPPAYVALGHWHNPTDPPLQAGNTKIAYSGSSYPLGRGELGKRKVFLIDVGEEVRVEGLAIPGVPCREKTSFFCLPGAEENVLLEVRDYLLNKADSMTILDLEITGWLAGRREDLFFEEIKTLVGCCREGWRKVNLTTPGFVGLETLSGLGVKCLQLLEETAAEEALLFPDPLVKQLIAEVAQEKELLHREALSILFRCLGQDPKNFHQV